MDHTDIKQQACQANLALVEAGLVILTWGNASALDPRSRAMAIKPSGVDYAAMTPDDMVVIDVASGEVLQGDLRPSSDAPTHLKLYRAFPDLGGIVHTHSTHATAWAQACREIPCYGTTHADQFHGPVPLARALTDAEVGGDYETQTGHVIVEHFRRVGLAPLHAPGVLVSHHGPFAWGPSAMAAVHSAIALEEIARIAQITLAIRPDAAPVPDYLADKHFQRKHGPDAYYGQK